MDALAPDANSLKAAQKLTTTAKWPTLGASDIALWGECQGSGKKPYRTRIDLAEPAFKCSCPSRKFPCKHALALFHLYVEDATNFAATDPPDWVIEWFDSRNARQEAKAKKAANKTASVDPKAQAKRIANREKKVQGGLAELRLWMHDLVRTGLAQTQSKPRGYFDDMAARLVDAQAPGLARKVRDLSSVAATQADWTTQLATELGQLQLIISTYEKQKNLPEPIRADVRRVVGWTDDQQELAQQEGVTDQWLALAQHQSTEEKLRVRKSWLWGQTSGQVALILDFAHGSAPFPNTLTAGKKFVGEVVFFPSNFPQRALIKTQESTQNITPEDVGKLAICKGFDAMLGAYATALSHNCWLEDFPVLLSQVTPTMSAESLTLLDHADCKVPLRAGFANVWPLLAISGGHPVDLIADWNGESLLPLAVWQDELTLLK